MLNLLTLVPVAADRIINLDNVAEIAATYAADKPNGDAIGAEITLPNGDIIELDAIEAATLFDRIDLLTNTATDLLNAAQKQAGTR